MKNRNMFFEAVLIVACVAGIIVTLSMFRFYKTKESAFNEKRATLIKQNLDLKDELSSLKKESLENTENIKLLEQEKLSILSTIKKLEQTNEDLSKSYAGKLKLLEEKASQVGLSSEVLVKFPLLQIILEKLQGDDTNTLEDVLDEALTNYEDIKSGNFIELEPIIVTGAANPTLPSSEVSTPLLAAAVNTAQILSIDRRHALIIIDKGRRDNIESGQTCFIQKNGEQIATAEIIGLRYKVSAAVIKNIVSGYSIGDITENDTVSIGG